MQVFVVISAVIAVGLTFSTLSILARQPFDDRDIFIYLALIPYKILAVNFVYLVYTVSHTQTVFCGFP